MRRPYQLLVRSGSIIFEPGDLTNLEVEIRTAITHTVTLKKVRSWLQGRFKKSKRSDR